MADPLIYNSIARYTIHGTYGGQEVANVLDMAVIPAGSTPRAQAVQEVGFMMIDAWWTMLNSDPINTGYTATLCSWVDLNSETGSTGSATNGVLHGFPKTGTSAGLRMPGNVTYKIRKSITGTRGRRSGSIFLAGVNEESTDNAAPNIVNSTYMALLTTRMTTLFNDLDGTIVGVATHYPVVCHTKLEGAPPVPVANGFSNVSIFTPENRLSSQRRRLGR